MPSGMPQVQEGSGTMVASLSPLLASMGVAPPVPGRPPVAMVALPASPLPPLDPIPSVPAPPVTPVLPPALPLPVPNAPPMPVEPVPFVEAPPEPPKPLPPDPAPVAPAAPGASPTPLMPPEATTPPPSVVRPTASLPVLMVPPASPVSHRGPTRDSAARATRRTRRGPPARQSTRAGSGSARLAAATKADSHNAGEQQPRWQILGLPLWVHSGRRQHSAQAVAAARSSGSPNFDYTSVRQDSERHGRPCAPSLAMMRSGTAEFRQVS